jgi:hypothetical protein
MNSICSFSASSRDANRPIVSHHVVFSKPAIKSHPPDAERFGCLNDVPVEEVIDPQDVFSLEIPQFLDRIFHKESVTRRSNREASVNASLISCGKVATLLVICFLMVAFSPWGMYGTTN